MSSARTFISKLLRLNREKIRCRTFRNLSVFVLLFLYTSILSAREYFQQRVDYTINAGLDDQQHSLSCFESIVYTNNSPDELSELYIHLWPNAYKDETTPLAGSFYMDGISTMLQLKKENNGYIDSLDFQVDGERVSWALLRDSIDICRIKLKKPLASGKSLTLSTPFHVKLPSAEISRLGHLGQAYYITQWYPKPAVYDNNGWNYFSYLDKGEYYGEFGSFDVSITLPENYVVGASGELLDNPQELEWLDANAEQTAKTDTFPEDMSFPPSSKNLKTLHFRQDSIHDFAWFADKRYHVLKGKVQVPGSTRTISTCALFTNAEASYWKKVPQYMEQAITYFSDWIGPYAYNQVTAADVTRAGGDAMEYPMITAIGSYGDPFELELTIAHEVAHNWFYGILGSNERRHAWMDEGSTNFFGTRYIYTKYEKDSTLQEETFTKSAKNKRLFLNLQMNHREAQYLSYLMNARRNADQAPDLPAEAFSRENYDSDIYYKTSLCFDYLLNYLGDSLFDRCMKDYFESWKFRHPQPEDMKASFVQSSGKNLDWLFNELIGTTKKIDYSFCTLKKGNEAGGYSMKLKNTGNISAPLSISSMKNGATLETIWLEGFTAKKTLELSCKDCDAFRIDAVERLPELYRYNNSIRTAGLLKRTERIKFDFLGGQEDPERTQIFYSPIAGWNYYNGVMAGLALYNVCIPEKKFEYTFAPMYAFKTKDLAGGGDMRYHFYPQQGIFQKITARTGFSHYAYGTSDYSSPSQDFTFSSTLKYSKLDSRLEFRLREKEPRKRIQRQITLRHVLVQKDLIYNPQFKAAPTEDYNYFQGEYLRENLNPLTRSQVKIQVTGNNTFYKLGLETNHFIHYKSEKKGFRVRFYAGYLHRSVTDDPGGADYRLRFSGYGGGVRVDGMNYSDDYLFDEIFLARSENSGILAQQFSVSEGGMTIPTFGNHLADKWLLSTHMSTTLPGILPFRIYLGLSTYNDASDYPESVTISYEAGIEFPVLKDIFVIYFPLMWSSDIRYILDKEEVKYGEIIRFELNLKKLNPLEFIRKVNF